MTRQLTISKALITLATIYDKDLSDEKLAGYLHYLDDLPEDTVLAAIRTAGTTCKWFPTVQEIRELITGSVIDQNAEIDRAWIEVKEQARKIGYNRPPVYINGEPQPQPERSFSNPLITIAVDSVGWRTICLGNDEKGSIASEFKWAYKRQLASAGKIVQTGEIGAQLADSTAARSITNRTGLRSIGDQSMSISRKGDNDNGQQ